LVAYKCSRISQQLAHALRNMIRTRLRFWSLSIFHFFFKHIARPCQCWRLSKPYTKMRDANRGAGWRDIVLESETEKILGYVANDWLFFVRVQSNRDEIWTLNRLH
jgi:hypothetical protein